MIAPSSGRLGALASPARLRKTLAWSVGAVAAFGVLGFFAAPPLVKSLIERKAGEALHRKVSLGGLAINPYALSAELTGLSVRGESGDEVAGLDRLYLNLEAASLFRGGPVIRELQIDGPRLAVTRLEGNRYDVSDLIDEWSKPSEDPTPRFAVNNIRITGGRVVLNDQPTGLTHTVSDLALILPFVSSLPVHADIEVDPHFSALINGAPLVLEGRSKPFADSHESELRLDLDRVDLLRYLPYSPVKLPFTVAGARLDTELRLVFRQDKDAPASVRLLGAAHLSDVALREGGDRPLLAWKRLDIEVGEADLTRRHVALDRIRLSGLDLGLRATPQGRLNWQDIAAALGGGDAKGGESSAPGKLTWSVAEVAVEGATLRWRDETRGKPFLATLGDFGLTLRQLEGRLEKPLELDASFTLEAGSQFRLGRGEIKGARIDLARRLADLGELTLTAPRLEVLRDRNKTLDLPQGPLLKGGDGASTGTPWTVAARRVALVDGGLRYREEGQRDRKAQTLDGLQISLEDFSTAPGKKSTLQVAARINEKGSLKVSGDIQASPLVIALDTDISGFPLLPIQPYFEEKLNVTLVRGQLSSRGKLAYSLDKDRQSGGFKGDLTLGDLHSIDNLSGADFLKWKSLFLGGIDVALQPFALNVREVALADFYARMIVTPEGQLNLMQIVRKPEGETVPGAPPATAAAVPSPASEQKASVPPVPAAAAAPATAREVAPIRIAKASLSNGTVNFSDYFVKPNYTVNVTRLSGRVTGLSSQADTVADLELHGSYGNAAPVDVSAKLNPLAAKAFLDLKGEIRGVDLTTLSTYAGKYAGYAIDKGKLSLYVSYKLADRQLSAENRIFLDQLTFGDKVDSPDATGLPVKLAVALLKNGRGEIDINLPISGSLEDPQFSLGGIIVRVIVNLFVKAVTSPFTLIASLFGGGEELSMIDFDPGRTALGTTAVKRLESLAKAMADRPALNLEITGRADPETEREGMKRAALDRAVRAEKLREQARRGVEGGSAEGVEVKTEEYADLLRRVYKEAKFPKPRNLIGMQKDLPVEEMEKLLLANLATADEDVRQLAQRRGEVVQAWLVEQGKIPMERVFLLPPKVGADPKADPKASPSRVDFSLR